MRNVQRGHHGNAFRDVALRFLGNVVHFLVDVGNRRQQRGVFFGRAGDAVFLAEQGDVEIVGFVGHEGRGADQAVALTSGN